jgi:predicted permease
MTLFSTFSWHLQSAARKLWRNPAFTLTALVTLSLGVGSVSALLSVVDKVLLEPLPYPDPSRLVQLITTSQVGQQRLVSIPQYIFWCHTTTSFESMAASDVDGPEVNLTQGPNLKVLKAARISADYFHVFGVQLAIGRTFSAHEDSPEGPRVVVISDGLWRRDFDSDSSLVGRTIFLDNDPYTVVGVLSPGAHLESPADLWLPLCADPHSVDHIARVRVVARLRGHISIEDARKEVGGGLQAFLQKYPPYSQFGAPALFEEEFSTIPLREAVVGEVRPALYLLMGAVGFVLAISCANTATLLLASASRRTREIAVRIAVGAERKQLLFHFLAESLLLSLSSGVGSLVLGYLGVRGLLAISPSDLPRFGANGSPITLDWRVFFFTLFVSVLVGLLCALIPAAGACRTDISPQVKDSTSQAGMNLQRSRWRSILTIVEVSFSLVLLVGAGLLIRTFVDKRAISRGFDEENVLTLEMSLDNPRFDNTTQVAQLVRYVERRFKAVQGVAAVATTCALPLLPGLPMPFTILRNEHSLLGRYDGTATWRSVSPQYFKVFQIRLLRGRMFTDEDDEKAARVALINRAMMKQFWQEVDANPIGHFISIGKGMEPGSGDAPRQIVGVVVDVRDAGLDREPSMYVPVAQVSDRMNARNNRLLPIIWAIRTDGAQSAPVVRIEQELASLSGGQPLGRPRTMHEAIAASSARTQFYMILLTVFACIALVLTATGLYGLMAYSVQRRSRELAIRMALGATRLDVQGMIVLQALRLTLWGILAGIPSALALARVTISLIFGTATWDPVLLGLVALLLCAVSLAAAYLPSMRACRVDPAVALRSEP